MKFEVVQSALPDFSVNRIASTRSALDTFGQECSKLADGNGERRSSRGKRINGADLEKQCSGRVTRAGRFHPDLTCK